MNKVILMGRLTRDPEIRYGGADNQTAIARFSLAVDRRFRRSGDSVEADFFDCSAFGKLAEFVERYLKQGTKVVLTGRIENNNYTNREGQKVYSTRIVAEELEFAESKASQEGRGGYQQAPAGGYQQAAPAPQSAPAGFEPQSAPAPQAAQDNGFMNVPDSVDDSELPFN
ncbi:MAG: single-stranded DNA-binding protein [Lachnospiraceae bacterium]|nr:single-stranded DNA-binding protein [Lachnospiraceae bacterium]